MFSGGMDTSNVDLPIVLQMTPMIFFVVRDSAVVDVRLLTVPAVHDSLHDVGLSDRPL